MYALERESDGVPKSNQCNIRHHFVAVSLRLAYFVLIVKKRYILVQYLNTPILGWTVI